MDFDMPCGVKNIEQLRGSNILITGATGLIGGETVRFISDLNYSRSMNITLTLLVRDKSKVNEINKKFGNLIEIDYIISDITADWEMPPHIDYAIHCASITDSRMMVEKPVEVISANLIGTYNLLCKLCKYHIKSAVYLSSMEVYGFEDKEKLLHEDDMRYLNPLAIRSSYPESKRMVENLCVAFYSEYHLPIKIARLAQTFGRGVNKNDKRAFAEFARCAIENRDIILRTNGKSKRMYLDTGDAVLAILTILLNGADAEAYNVANKDTFCSISEMAELVLRNIGDGSRKVKFDFANNNIYPPSHVLKLDTSKIEELGWQPQAGLSDIYKNMIEYWSET